MPWVRTDELQVQNLPFSWGEMATLCFSIEVVQISSIAFFLADHFSVGFLLVLSFFKDDTPGWLEDTLVGVALKLEVMPDR